MPDSDLQDLTELATTPADGDFLYIEDVSDTTMDASGTAKKIRVDNLLSGVSAGGGGKVLLQEITNASAGEFDFGPALSGGIIPSGYNRLIIEGTARGTSAGLDYTYVTLAINGDTTAANYFRQVRILDNKSGYHYTSSDNYVGTLAGAGATVPANHAGRIRMVIENYDQSSDYHMAQSSTAYYRATNRINREEYITVNKSILAAVTRLQIRASAHPTAGLTGTLRLYGEM